MLLHFKLQGSLGSRIVYMLQHITHYFLISFIKGLFPRVREAHCGYISLHEYVIMIKAKCNKLKCITYRSLPPAPWLLCTQSWILQNHPEVFLWPPTDGSSILLLSSQLSLPHWLPRILNLVTFLKGALINRRFLCHWLYKL